MTIDATSPVTAIEGIGPATAERLAEMRLYTVFDLLRAAPEQVHPAVSDIASLQEVRAWRTMALFLQVEGMTTQWAEALVQGGVDNLEELLRRSQSELLAVFQHAVDAGIIGEAPADEQLYELRIDAAALHYTGALNGTVRNADGNPLAGVEARMGARSGVTDARGRFRLDRLVLGVPQSLRLTVDGHAPRVVPVTVGPNDAVGVRIYTLQPTSPAAPAAPEARLSEYDGDVLPQLADGSMSTQARSADQLRDGDLLVLHRFYASGDEAELTSKFLEYQAGTFYAINYRVPLSKLPPGAKMADTFRYRAGEFRSIALHAAALQRFRLLRRLRKEMRSRPRPQTVTEIDVAIRERAARLRQLGEA